MQSRQSYRYTLDIRTHQRNGSFVSWASIFESHRLVVYKRYKITSNLRYPSVRIMLVSTHGNLGEISQLCSKQTKHNSTHSQTDKHQSECTDKSITSIGRYVRRFYVSDEITYEKRQREAKPHQQKSRKNWQENRFPGRINYCSGQRTTFLAKTIWKNRSLVNWWIIRYIKHELLLSQVRIKSLCNLAELRYWSTLSRLWTVRWVR